MSVGKISRRGFVKAAGLAVAGPWIMPASAFGANDRIGVGLIGAGRRGCQLTDDFNAVAKQANAEMIAISDLYLKRMEEAAKDKPWAKYQDYRELLRDKNVDAVIVATPDHWHTLPSLHACQAGKDVYCEKPLTLTVREGRALVQAARQHQRVFQTGSQQRSDAKCRLGCELIRNHRIGKVLEVHGSNYPSPWECTLPEEPVPDGLNWDAWCGQTQPRPYHKDLYLPRANPGWISFRPYSGGEMTGWGAHGLDIIQWALGMDESGPVEIWPEQSSPVFPIPRLDPSSPGFGFGKTEPLAAALKRPVSLRYANGIVVHLDEEKQHGGGLFVGESGTIRIDRAKLEITPENLGKEPIKNSEIHLYRSTNHMLNWLQCVRTRQKAAADVEIGHRSATLCHLGNIARWTGRKLHWDPEKETFVNDEDANRYLERPMRDPYALSQGIGSDIPCQFT